MKTLAFTLVLSLLSLNLFAAENKACQQKAIKAVQSVLAVEFTDAQVNSIEVHPKSDEDAGYSNIYNVFASADDGWYNLVYRVEFEKFGKNEECGHLLVLTLDSYHY